MAIKLLFEQLARARETTNLPLILMGYINPVFKFGMENFLHKCQKTGIDGQRMFMGSSEKSGDRYNKVSIHLQKIIDECIDIL